MPGQTTQWQTQRSLKVGSLSPTSAQNEVSDLPNRKPDLFFHGKVQRKKKKRNNGHLPDILMRNSECCSWSRSPSLQGLRAHQQKDSPALDFWGGWNTELVLSLCMLLPHSLWKRNKLINRGTLFPAILPSPISNRQFSVGKADYQGTEGVTEKD